MRPRERPRTIRRALGTEATDASPVPTGAMGVCVTGPAYLPLCAASHTGSAADRSVTRSDDQERMQAYGVAERDASAEETELQQYAGTADHAARLVDEVGRGTQRAAGREDV